MHWFVQPGTFEARKRSPSPTNFQKQQQQQHSQKFKKTKRLKSKQNKHNKNKTNKMREKTPYDFMKYLMTHTFIVIGIPIPIQY